MTLELFHKAATEFARELSHTPLPELFGATDGKAVGTKVESMFKNHLTDRYDLTVGNAANGLDFPSLNLDLKVTSYKQPQSSCPFRNAKQKIYGLGYNLLVVVYMKRDEPEEKAAYLDIKNVIYVDKERTGDHTLTRQIRELVLGPVADGSSREAVIEDLDALLQDKNVPLDDVGRRELSERLIDDVPRQGVITISNALQWRLQYSRTITAAESKQFSLEVVELRA